MLYSSIGTVKLTTLNRSVYSNDSYKSHRRILIVVHRNRLLIYIYTMLFDIMNRNTFLICRIQIDDTNLIRFVSYKE